MKIIMGKNATIYNVKFEGMEAIDISCEEAQQINKPPLRIRIAARIFNIIAGGRIKPTNVICYSSFDFLQPDGTNGSGFTTHPHS